jgi:3-polyprenyl-4-hydroxybenzoate decarboxylase
MKNLIVAFTGSVASTLNEKLLDRFSKDKQFNIKVVVTESAKQFVDCGKLMAKGYTIRDDFC